MTATDSRIIVHMAASLDGFIERADGDMGWFDTADVFENGKPGEDPEEFARSIDCHVMGSRTYELAERLGWIYGDGPVTVLTSRPLPAVRPNVEYRLGDLEDILAGLRARHRSIWVIGGAGVVGECIRRRLADEIRIAILPVLLGGGTPFFAGVSEQQGLHLCGADAYRNGIVELRYEILR